MHRSLHRPARLAFLLLPGLDHFAHDLVAGLPALTGWEVRPFHLANRTVLDEALAWTDCGERDALWFEFCWPPFPRLIAETDFANRRVIVRVHRIEAMEAPYVAQTPWQKVHDVVVVSEDMAARVRQQAPGLADIPTRLHCIHNGLDMQRFVPLRDWDPFRIGWCGLMTLRKNPVLALQVLFSLHVLDARYSMRFSSNGGEKLATESFMHLARRLDLLDAIVIDRNVPQQQMPAWHGRNGVLLHTSLHESFGYAIAEAGAVGCDLAVLEHPGADEFWPETIRYGTVDEAVWLIRNAAPHRWRDHVARHCALEHQLTRTAAMLCSPTSGEAP